MLNAFTWLQRQYRGSFGSGTQSTDEPIGSSSTTGTTGVATDEVCTCLLFLEEMFLLENHSSIYPKQ